MYKEKVQIFYKELIDNLTDSQFLRKIKLSKKAMLEIIDLGDWKDNISKFLLDDINVDCKGVLSICEKTLNQIAFEPGTGWLDYTYHYTLSKLFPENRKTKVIPSSEQGRLFYLEVLRTFLEFEKATRPFDPTKHIEMLTKEQLADCPAAEEYRRFLKILNDDYIYEFMRIGTEISGYNTLGHIGGVHYVSMHIGNQLAKAQVPIDLALLSGAAAGHDIGKYGCKSHEAERVPYLHYYYTDMYFKNNHMPGIGHIATNHSTWDLELENLSVESLILIYADFRVKSKREENGREYVHFYSLKDSFDIILNKLDNVDEKKKARYIRVYAKLADFEDYMLSLGINTDLTSDVVSPAGRKDAALMNPEEVIQELKFIAIRHNILLMHRFNSEVTFGNLLEAARSETNWKNVRAYINIFQEYDTYMTQKQKLITLQFLYELLMHREGDIRRQSAELLGNMIIHFDEEYRKELPEGVKLQYNEITSRELWKTYLDKIITPDHKVTDQHRRWLGYTMKIITSTIFDQCKPEETTAYLEIMLEHYQTTMIGDAEAFILLDALLSLPLYAVNRKQIKMLALFCQTLALRDSLEIQVAALQFFRYLSEVPEYHSICTEMMKTLSRIGSDENISVSYLKTKIRNNMSKGITEKKQLRKKVNTVGETAPGIFLDNLKAATPWAIKLVNIEYLLEQVRSGNTTQVLQVAAHFANLIKVSERVIVRHSAGRALVSIAPLLTLEQRNEIAVDLTKGLEIGQYEFSKYIPEYLGEFALFLHPYELDELINNFRKLLESINDRVGSVTLDTLGIILLHYPSYRERFPEDLSDYLKRKETILGLIMKGLSSYIEVWNQEAFLVVGKILFGSKLLTLQEKYEIFQLIYKKMLTLITDERETELSFFNSAASLNHIYRFLSDYSFYYGAMKLQTSEKIAFYPGTFDPFSVSHQRIVSEVRNMGFEVYLSVDEFTWSKRIQPKLMRRRIASMSVASEKNVYLFPDDIPVNIGNPLDLAKLSEIFSGREIFIVIGSDVIKNASAYQDTPSEMSIHSWNHIIFRRRVNQHGEPDHSMITGKVVEFSLPMNLDEISSSNIRDNIDENRDVTYLIDPLAQHYIYDNGLYLREPSYKRILNTDSIQIDVVEHITEDILSELEGNLLNTCLNKNQIKRTLLYERGKTLIIRDGETRKIAGIASFASSKDLAYSTESECVIIVGIAADKESKYPNMEQIILTELLTYGIRNQITRAYYQDHYGTENPKLIELLKRQGFLETKSEQREIGDFEVDMRRPVVLIDDALTVIKEPFSSNEKVRRVIAETHAKFQQALISLYPGNLVLSFDSHIMQQRMVTIITSEKETADLSAGNSGLKSSMCVPFGKILRGVAIPGMVTKSLHTEKVFEPGINQFHIKEFPNYSPLTSQIRAIKSFQRPVLLIDDLLHSGHRMRKLDPILRQEGLDVEKLIVGILSGRGRALMEEQGRQVESVYYLPNMLSWFSESSMYPYIGGDSVRRETKKSSGILPSINMVLPYVAPRFLLYVPKEPIYEFSMTCLENTRSILMVLEQEYQALFERNLTLNRLSEAILSPRYPDHGANITYDFNLAPSVYINNDIERLIRLKTMFL